VIRRRARLARLFDYRVVVESWLSTVQAQATAVETLRRALGLGRVHHAYLFDGPDGVGKERAAFGLAQALVCERRPEGAPDACGECRACVRALPRAGERRPLHPDVVVLERGLYEPAMLGRRTPETQDLSIDQVRTLVLARAAFGPLEGRAKVFVVRRAEELSISAANALLKTLEEPGPRTHFVLLSSTADALLSTIRSRTQRVRFGALPEAVVTELLIKRGVEGALAAEIAGLSGGSMATALMLGDPEASAQREQFVARALQALEARTVGGALELAEDAKKGDKATLVVQIEALASALAAQARSSAAAPDRRADTAAARHALALSAVQQLGGNASLQLTVEAMLMKMRNA
jgi:DNA polymerase-3 subunit delta'